MSSSARQLWPIHVSGRSWAAGSPMVSHHSHALDRCWPRKAAASESLRRTSASDSPMIFTTFRGDEPPETIFAPPFDNPSTLMSRDSTAAFAFPRSGGAVTRTRKVSPSHPAIPLREDPGITLTGSLKLTALNTNAPRRSSFSLDETDSRS
jgi:hypothetical protein